MKSFIITLLLIGQIGIQASSLLADEFFEKKVRPLLIAKCFQCHAGTKAAGGLSLETKAGWSKGGESGPAIVPGNVEESLLLDAINYRGLEMPPADKGGKLTNEEISVLTTWIRRGAVDPRKEGMLLGGMSREEADAWWSYQPIQDPNKPTEPNTIDRFINHKLQKNGLTAQGSASRRELIRRATYDLTGLPPSYQEVLAFERDTSVNAFAKVIDRLLNSKEYGVHWGRHWLDVVRYADTAGENSDRPLPHAWRYRNWVIDSFNHDLPFQDFVQQQLSGDLSPLGSDSEQTNAGIIATGYLAVARRYGHDINKDIHLMHEDVIDNVGKAFLGMTIGCARCHDHKYDPITADDYYALYGIFSSTQFAFPGCEPIPQPANLISLAMTGETQKKYQQYLALKAEFDASRPNNPETIAHLKGIAEQEATLLATANVTQSGKQFFADHLDSNSTLSLKKGEAIQLRIHRNANYGADTTGIVLEINNTKVPEKSWSSQELVGLIDSDAPIISVRGAKWGFLDTTSGPKFLVDKKRDIGGHSALRGWANGDNPSFFANTGNTAIAAWTSLPPKTLFTHPGPLEDSGLVWVCPEEGEYSIDGHVLDGHPGAGDGVTFFLEHISSSEYGEGITQLGTANGNLTPPTPVTQPLAYAVTEGTVADASLHLRGDPEQVGDAIPRRWLSVFGATPLANPTLSGRLELANWIVEHPLFARVLANRIWQWHFGRGIVTTPNDFGSRGAAPSHPELLEFLAHTLKSANFQLKPVHRLIMLSETYQRSSQVSKLAKSFDPTNRWLSHYSARRLSAEEIRDSLLAVSKQLDKTPGKAHPFPPEESWSFSQHAPFNAVYETTKRSAYLMVQRQRRHPFLALFDGPDPNASTPQRQQTTVPTQALYFLNDEFFHSCANQAAIEILTNEASSPAIEQLYALFFQRLPTDDEVSVTADFLRNYDAENEEKWQAISRILLASNEFLYVD